MIHYINKHLSETLAHVVVNEMFCIQHTLIKIDRISLRGEYL